MQQRIAWIGTGVMGTSMAGHLINAGHHLVIHSRTKSKAQGLLDRGALWAETPAAAADGADIAISMVGYPEDVEAVHLSAIGTLAAARLPKMIHAMRPTRRRV